MTANPPLNYEPSLSRTNTTTSTTLPVEVVQCLRNCRYLHLATISYTSDHTAPPTPHVSLMNYTFLPNYNSTGPVIIMTTNTQSLKTQNLRSNPRVSLLVHDWSSHRPPTATNISGPREGSPPAATTRSSLASLLVNLNTSALSSISTTITGMATILESGSEEERWCKDAHLQNNTFEGQTSLEAGYFGSGGPVQNNTDGSGYIVGEDVRVVLVPVKEGRISDFKGAVRDWLIVAEDHGEHGDNSILDARGRDGTMLNGVT